MLSRLRYFFQYLMYLIHLSWWRLRHPHKPSSHQSTNTPLLSSPWSFFRSIRNYRRYLFLLTLFALPTLLVLSLYLSRSAPPAAAWYNDSWAFRKAITITNNTTAEANVYIAITGYDASDTTKYQGDCGDVRFTKENGQLLPYYVSSCGASTTFHIELDTFPAGAQTIYLYYGNPSADNGFSASDFSTVASDYTITATGSEALAPGPAAYWKFDEGVDNTCSGGTNDACDSTSNVNDGAFGASTAAPTWKPQSECISGKCLYFDGSNDITSITSSSSLESSTNITISAWIKANTTQPDTYNTIVRRDPNTGAATRTLYVLDLSSGYLRLTFIGKDSSDITTGTSTITNLKDNRWHHVVIVRDNTNSKAYGYVDGNKEIEVTDIADGSFNGTDTSLQFGQWNTDATNRRFAGYLDEVKIYPFARTAAEIKTDYLRGAAAAGSSAVLGAQTTGFLNNGLVAYWKMNEVSGNAADSSGNGTTLTNNSSTVFSPAKYGNGAEPDGTADYFSAADNATLSLTGSVTLSAWINPDDVSGSQDIIGKWDGTNNSYLLALEGDELRMYIDSASNYQTTTASNLTAAMTHVAGTFNAATQTVRLYVNGVLQASTTTGTIPASIGDDAGAIVVGADNSPTNYFDGHIDEARIYNRALSAAEIRQMVDWIPGPVGYWNFDEASGTVLHDLSGVGNNGSLQNFPASPWVTGKYGGALEFAGTNDYVETDPTTSDLKILGNLTFSLWAYRRSSGSVQNLIDQTAPLETEAVNRLYQLTINATNYLETEWEYGAGSNQGVTSSVPLTTSTNEWVNIAVVRDTVNKTVIFYENGKQLGTTQSYTYNPTGGGSTFMALGRNHASLGEYFNGFLDEYRIYDYIRTPSQILQDMQQSNKSASVLGTTSGGVPIPIAWYKFDEQQGQTVHATTPDQSSTLDGTLGADSGSSTDDPTWKTSSSNTCHTSGCLYFDGTSDYTTSPSPFDPSTTDFSASTWFYLNGTPSSASYYNFISQASGTGTGRGWLMVKNSGGTIYLGSYLVGSDHLGVTPISTGNWYHAVITKSGTTVKLYLNSKLENTFTLTTEAADGVLLFGTNVLVSGNWLSGLMDDTKIYNFALTPDQVKLDYNNSSVISASVNQVEAANLTDTAGNPPVGYWDFEDNTGTSVTDKSGNGYTLTGGGSIATTSWIPGHLNEGAGLNFNGSDDQASMAAGAANLMITGDVTLNGWFYRRSTSKTETLIDYATAGETQNDNRLYQLTVNSSNYLEMEWEYGSGSNETVTSSTTISPVSGAWTYLSAVRNVTANTVTFYQNGIQLGTTQSYTNDPDGGSNASFGLARNEASLSEYFDGRIDDVKIYDYARTPAQIAYDYNRGAPIAWYKMDECEGTTIHDASGNSLDGTLTTTTTGGNTNGIGTCNTSTSAWGTGATGKFGSSLNFDGNGDYVTISDSSNRLDSGSNDFSYSAWFKTSDSSNTISIISRGTTNDWEFAATKLNTNLTRCKIYQSNSSNAYLTADSTTTVNDNTWHFTTCVLSGTTLYNYLDGKLESSNSSTSGTRDTSSAGEFYIGQFDYSTHYYFTGLIDDVRIYNYALSATQVKKLYNENSSIRFGP